MKKQLGYTIVEILIALSIGLVLFAGVLAIFVGMKTTAVETSAYGELQENGRFALSVLTDDLQKSDFWGDYVGTLDLLAFPTIIAPPATDCVGDGLNNATFPVALGSFRTLWGITTTTANNMGCINDAVIGSDIIQIKRVLGNAINTAVNPTTANNYYMVTNSNGGQIFTGAGVPNVVNSRVWEYQHHVYYIRTSGANNIPVLMQGRLTSTMTFDPIIDGIEMIRFMYGVDTDDDGIVNTFLSANTMNLNGNLWDRSASSRIIAVKIYVLARSIRADNNYNNTNSYQLGDLPPVVFNDNFRRLLFSSTVSLANAQVNSWGN